MARSIEDAMNAMNAMNAAEPQPAKAKRAARPASIVVDYKRTFSPEEDAEIAAAREAMHKRLFAE
ncbi:MAG: hypothetical protein ACKVOP_08590 [Sphingomonadaceae bacterium]